MTGRRLALRWAGLLTAAAVACWLGGLFWFVHLTRWPAELPPAHADGVVALTGGAGRIELALHLLESGRAERLLISGIGGRTELGTLGRITGIDTGRLASRITLGRYAVSTRGNGVETAAGAEHNGIRTLLVVTAGYHMPRALAELRQALPHAGLLPMPVQPQDGDATPEEYPGWRLEASEYVKYLLTISGVSGWLPRREATGLPSPAARARA